MRDRTSSGGAGNKPDKTGIVQRRRGARRAEDLPAVDPENSLSDCLNDVLSDALSDALSDSGAGGDTVERRGEPHAAAEPDCEETIHKGGFRFTRQRREVYDALMARRDHPTAVEIFLRVKDRVPNISLATVYNCLETLTKCGLVRQVNLERAPSRFCPNLQEHGHFFCEECGKVMDVAVTDPQGLAHSWQLPTDCVVTNQEFTLRGLCPECARVGAGK